MSASCAAKSLPSALFHSNTASESLLLVRLFQNKDCATHKMSGVPSMHVPSRLLALGVTWRMTDVNTFYQALFGVNLL